MNERDTALSELPDGVTLEDLLIPLRAALSTCHDTDWSLRQFKPHITHALAALQPAAVSAEREACARLCDARGVKFHSESPFAAECHGLAEAIRARGDSAQQATPEPVQHDGTRGPLDGAPMNADKAAYFMRRFKREEKLLGPNEQLAIDFVLSMLTATPEPVGEPDAWLRQAKQGPGVHDPLVILGAARPTGYVAAYRPVAYCDAHTAPGVPEVHKIDVGFRWDGDAQQHIPSMVIEFEPVKAGDPTDAKGWRDRDALAAMLAAAQAKGGE